MTYHDRSLTTASGSIDISGLPAEQLFHGALDRKSRIVIGLSLRDPSSSVDRDRPGSRLLSRLFGISAPAPLADPRLESLRRFCILYRDGDPRCMAEADLLTKDFGYSESDLDEVRTEIGLRTKVR